ASHHGRAKGRKPRTLHTARACVNHGNSDPTLLRACALVSSRRALTNNKFGLGEENRIRCLARRRCMSRGSFLAAAAVPLSLLLRAGWSNPSSLQEADHAATAICGVCRVGTSGGPAGGGGQRPPVPEVGVKVIVRDSRGKRTITEATSSKGGEYKI